MRNLVGRTAAIRTTRFLAIAILLDGCGQPASPFAPPRAAIIPTETTSSEAVSKPEGDRNPPSCSKLMARHIEYINKITDKTIQIAKFIQERGYDSVDYDGQRVQLSLASAKIDQDLLAFCADAIDSSTRQDTLADLSENFAEAGRAQDALLIANECNNEFHDGPYCVAASAKALHRLHRNAAARIAAQRVINRGPFDSKIASEINVMQSLITLMDAEDKARTLSDQRRDRQ